MSKTFESDKILLKQLRSFIYTKSSSSHGDFKLLRFLRSNCDDPFSAARSFKVYLTWREENGIERIRERIITSNFNYINKYPSAHCITSKLSNELEKLKLLDTFGLPNLKDIYKYQPSLLSKSNITSEEYILFINYIVEYKSLVLEQLSYAQNRLIFTLPNEFNDFSLFRRCRLFQFDLSEFSIFNATKVSFDRTVSSKSAHSKNQFEAHGILTNKNDSTTYKSYTGMQTQLYSFCCNKISLI
jgi:hypothetical protein